jgi:hypothetical protein
MISESNRSKWMAAAVLVWLAAAMAIGASGVLQSLRPPAPQIVLVSLTILLISAGVFIPEFRNWAETVDLRIPVALHLTRFVGAYFLVLCERGELPAAWAVPSGWGDIAVAVLATILLATTRPTNASGRRLYLGWNAFGFIDIVLVVAGAARQGFADPESMRTLLQLPLSLLVTFLVPLIIASHVMIFARLWKAPAPKN